MIYVNRAYWCNNTNRWRSGESLLVNPEHIVTISPIYIPPGTVLNTEHGMGMIYDLETTAHNSGYTLKVTGTQLDKLFAEELEKLQTGSKEYKGFGVTK